MKVIAIGGPSGIGKTTLAGEMKASHENAELFSTDYEFEVDGEYKWDVGRLPEYHVNCQKKFGEFLMRNKGRDDAIAIVHNTFTLPWHVYPYWMMSQIAGVKFNLFLLRMQEIEDLVEIHKRNVHQVPLTQIFQQAANICDDSWIDCDIPYVVFPRNFDDNVALIANTILKHLT
jgi:hypothetical protein